MSAIGRDAEGISDAIPELPCGEGPQADYSVPEAAPPAAALDLDALEKVARAVRPHLIHTGWQRGKSPVFGEWFIYADNGRGMGRQHIANTPADKSYGFTDLSEFIATFDPPTVLRLVEQQRELLEVARRTVAWLTRKSRSHGAPDVQGNTSQDGLPEDDPTTPVPEAEGGGERAWRCFHCDEVFTTTESAAEHFGKFMDCEPACAIGVQKFREMENELAAWRSESDPASKEFYALGAKHADELRREEEKGYARGLIDGRALSSEAPPVVCGGDGNAIRALAEAWASMDGKLDKYRRDDGSDPLLGYRDGYDADAAALAERLERRGFRIVPAVEDGSSGAESGGSPPQEAAKSDRLSEMEDERDDYRERLHDLVMIDSEEWATGGGPGFKERRAKAWARAREPFEP